MEIRLAMRQCFFKCRATMGRSRFRARSRGGGVTGAIAPDTGTSAVDALGLAARAARARSSRLCLAAAELEGVTATSTR